MTLAEGDTGTTDFIFTISTDLLSSKDLGVTVDTNDLLEAMGGTDYTVITAEAAVIAAGTDTTTVTVSVTGDEIVEVDETFTLDLSSALFDGLSDGSRVLIGDGSGLGTIVNDDTATLSIDDVTLAEGDSGTTDFVFTVNTDLFSSKDLGVTVDTNDLFEAVGGTDYTVITAEAAVIAAGTDTTTVMVSVTGDEIVEVDETFTLDLSSALFDGVSDNTRVVIGDGSGLGTIVNDDTATLSVDDVTLAEGDTGTTDFVFTISTDLFSSKDLGVTVDTNDLLEAIGGVDYTRITSQSAVITAGTNTTTVTVSVAGDEIMEIDETFTLDLSSALFDGASDNTRVVIGDGSGLGTIVNDDTATLSIDDVTLGEGDVGTTDFVFTISTDLFSSKDLGVTVDTNDLLEAVGGTDYISITSQAAFIAAGTDTTTVTVSVTGDKIVEIDETFTLDLSAALFNGISDGTRVVIGDGSGLGTIVNDDTATLSIDDVTLAEGDTGTTDFVFTISADLFSSKDLGVTVDTNDLLEAVGGTDYTSITSQSAVITAGTGTTTVTVSVTGDAIVEIDETFTLDLSSALFNGVSNSTRVVIGDGSGLGTIVNDDTATLSIDDVSLAEGDTGTTDFVFTISTDLFSSKDLGVTIDTNDLLEAVGGSDYTVITGQAAVIAAGTDTTTVTVSVTGDEIVEIDETFTLDLSSALFDGVSDNTRVVIGDDSGLGTIVNDDTATISINDVSLAEGDAGTTDFVFTISTDLFASKDLGVTVDTNDLLEAIGGTDYTSITSQSAVITAGTDATTVTVSVTVDEIVEIDETFTLDLSSVLFDGVSDNTRVVLGDGSGLGTIVNDDTATLSIDDVTLTEGDTGTTAFVFTVSADLISSKDLGVTVDTSDLLEAVGGTDYTSITAQPAVITAGTNATTVTVNVTGDEIVEIDETFTLDLSAALFDNTSDDTRVVIGDGSGLGTIVNDDTATLSINDVTLQEGDNGTTDFVFTISTDLVSSQELGVIVNAADLADSVGGSDLVPVVNQVVTISAGAAASTVTISVRGDSVVERDEAFAVDLSDVTFDGRSDATRAVIGDGQGIGMIVNDDVANVSINDISVLEGDQGVSNVVFTISMDTVSALDTTLIAQSLDGTQALASVDYLGFPSQDVTIAAGQTSTTIAAQVIADSIVEIDETFLIQLSNARFGDSVDATRIQISDSTGVGTILNDDSAQISIEDVTAIEGDFGITDFEFTIRQDAVASLDTSVTVNTSDILQAIAGVDYNAIVNETVTIMAGSQTAILTVGVIGEALVEATEAFRVELSDATFGGFADTSRLTIGVSTATGTILNDDAGDFLVDDLIVNESDGTVNLTVSLANPIDTDATWQFSLDSNPDIENLDTQIVFRAGNSQSQSIRLVIEDDLLVEGTESYIGFFELMTRDGDNDITAMVATSIEIVDNDKATFDIGDMTVDEAAGTISLEVALDTAFDIDASFTVSTAPQSDISFVDPTVTFASGSTETQIVTVTVNDDQLVELSETIDIQLIADTGMDLGDRDVDATDVGLFEIVDNDMATFFVQDLMVREDDGTVMLTVSVDNPIDIDTTFSIILGENDDIIVGTPTITFVAGSNQNQSFELEMVNDEIEELPTRIEALPVLETELGTRAVAAPESIVITVRDDDTPDFLQDLNENILTSTVPILVTSSGPGGSNSASSGSGSGGDSGGASNSNNATQSSGDAPADGSPDAGAADVYAGVEAFSSTGSGGQESSLKSTQSSGQSLSGSEGGSEVEDASTGQSKNTSTDSEFASDTGELLFHVVLPNGKLGEKFQLDIDLLNEDEDSLFDRFRGLPSDVYRVLYREPGSDTFQQLFEIYVVDGKIETILYSRESAVEEIDPASDDTPIPVKPTPAGPQQGDATPAADDLSNSRIPQEIGRFATPMLAAAVALARPVQSKKTSHVTAEQRQDFRRMDRVSRLLRRLP
ncbi:MAG: Calx-beta domain-containing protein [Planctomycetota bacterium]